MKKFIVSTCLFFLATSVFAQTDTMLASLQRRLDSYNKFNKELNFVKLMDYIHPSLFTIAPKKDIIAAFAQAFDNDQISITIDSISTLSISDDFNLKKANYRKVDYFMIMSLKFKDAEKSKDEAFMAGMLEQFKQAFSSKTVAHNKQNNSFEIKGNDVLFAIKDSSSSQWMFLGYDPSNAMVQKLFPAELLSHFKLQ